MAIGMLPGVVPSRHQFWNNGDGPGMVEGQTDLLAV